MNGFGRISLGIDMERGLLFRGLSGINLGDRSTARLSILSRKAQH